MRRRKTIALLTGWLLISAVCIAPRLVQRPAYEPVTGRVVDLARTTFDGMGEGAAFERPFPVIEYRVEGTNHHYANRTEILLRDFEIGEEVRLVHRRSNPAKARIDSLLGYWTPVPGLIIWALTCLIWLGGWLVLRRN